MSKVTVDPAPRVKSTRASIILAGGAVLLIMWALVGASILAARQAAMDRTRAEGHNLAVAFADEAIRMLDNIVQAGDIVAGRLREENGQFDLYGWSTQAALPWGIIQATFIGPDGKVVSSTVEPHPAPIDLADRKHFRIHLDGKVRGVFIGQTVFGRLWRQPIIPITRRIDANDGRFLGVLVFMIDPGSLTRLHKLIDLGPQDIITLEGTDNVIRARFSRDSQDGTKGIGASVAGGPRPSVIAENGEGSHVRAGIVDGLTRLFSYRRIGSYPLVVTVGLDLDAALAATHTDAWMIISMAGLATVLLLALGFHLIRQDRLRAAHEMQLAEERRKLRLTNIELIESKERAEAASRAKTTFLANMSHELRTPLNAIIGFSELLMGGYHGSLRPKQREYLEAVHQSGGHLLSVIGDVLDLAKIEAGQFELRQIAPVDCRDIAQSAVDLMREHASTREVDISFHAEPALPPIAADAGRVKQILFNLLDNAIKFSPRHGTVTLMVQNAGADSVEFIVADNGPGMGAEEARIALQPFSQVDDDLSRRHQGTGLGLPLAQRLAEIHGGSLRIESEKSRGTRVVVRLPLAHAVDEIEQHAEELVTLPSQGKALSSVSGSRDPSAARAYRTRDGDPGDTPPSRSRTA